MKDEQKKNITKEPIFLRRWSNGYSMETQSMRNILMRMDSMPIDEEINEFQANAHLFEEAHFVFSRTNKTPGELEERIANLEAALDEIINPIKYMQLRLKEGEQLNGQFAIVNSNSAEYLREIARNAKTPPTA